MSETVTGILRAVIGAFVGTVGFAMLVHVPKKSVPTTSDRGALRITESISRFIR